MQWDWRGLAELLSRRVRLVRQLPPEFGSQRLHVSPAASLALWRRDLASVDRQLLRWASELTDPGMVVWDIGANSGIFTFAAAFEAGPRGHVVAVEADPWLAKLLRCSNEHRDCPRAEVAVVEAAVTDTEGPVRFCIAARGRSANHLAGVAGSSQAGGVRKVVELRGTTLDALLRDHPAPEILKIDIEGAEALCFKGAQVLITRHRPIVLCEVHDESREAVTAFLVAHGYLLFDGEEESADRRPMAVAPWNTLAIPRRDGEEAWSPHKISGAKVIDT